MLSVGYSERILGWCVDCWKPPQPGKAPQRRTPENLCVRKKTHLSSKHQKIDLAGLESQHTDRRTQRTKVEEDRIRSTRLAARHHQIIANGHFWWRRNEQRGGGEFAGKIWECRGSGRACAVRSTSSFISETPSRPFNMEVEQSTAKGVGASCCV
jgi:hypothetical protein